MQNIILTTPEELKSIIKEVLKNNSSFIKVSNELPDTITLDTAIKVLKEFGYPTSKAKIYKLTSNSLMPFRKYGNKLVFSRKQLLIWAEKQTTSPDNTADILVDVVKSAKRKR